jgi:hypothetical protein
VTPAEIADEAVRAWRLRTPELYTMTLHSLGDVVREACERAAREAAEESTRLRAALDDAIAAVASRSRAAASWAVRADAAERLLNEAREALAAHAPPIVPWCPQCGPEPGICEDGTCSTCGCDVGMVPDWRASALKGEAFGRDAERAAVVAFVHDLPTLAQQIRDGEHRGKP